MNKKIVYEFYLLSMIGHLGLSFTYGTYVVFLREHRLDLFQVNMINFVYFATLTFCEIPTGAFADIFGRKYSYIISCILMSLGLLIYAGSATWLFFILAEATIAIGSTFRSGAFGAWFVDRMKHDGYTGSLQKTFARAEQLQRITCMVAVVIGSALSEIWSPFPFMLGSLSFFINAMVAIFIKEEYFKKEKLRLKESFLSFKKITLDSIKICRNNEAIKFIMLLISLQFFAIQTVNMHWQPFFNEWVDNRTFFGFITVGFNLCILFGNWVSPFIYRKINCEKKSLIFCQSLIALFIILTSLCQGFLCESFLTALIFFYVHEFFRGGFTPIKSSYLHENITSKERATISSLESLVQHGVGMLGLLISGLIARQFGVSATWFLMGSFLFITTLFFTRKRKVRW